MQGMSPRWGDEPVKATGMTGISKSQVSRLREEIDGKIAAFLNRPQKSDWLYLWLDATYMKGRRDGRVVSVMVIVAVAVNSDGPRDVLGKAISASEAATFWADFLRSLARCSVTRLMRAMGLQGAERGKASNTTLGECAAVCPADRVSRQFQAMQPNALSLSDFTYVATDRASSATPS